MVRPDRSRTSVRLTVADLVALGAGCLALVTGVLVLALVHGTVASVIGICLIGLCGVALVALLFLRIGESEDREYERERDK